MKNITKWMLAAALAIGGLGLAATPAKAAQIGFYIGNGARRLTFRHTPAQVTHGSPDIMRMAFGYPAAGPLPAFTAGTIISIATTIATTGAATATSTIISAGIMIVAELKAGAAAKPL